MATKDKVDKVQQLQSAAYNREFKQITTAGAATAAVT